MFGCRRARTSRSLRYVGAVSVSESAGRAPVQVLVLSNHLSSIIVDRQIGSIVVPDKYRPSSTSSYREGRFSTHGKGMTKAGLVRYRIVRARLIADGEELSRIEYNRMETICYLGTLLRLQDRCAFSS